MPKKRKGFTLVELMVVIAVIAVLATVSIVGYKSYVRRENINASITEAEQVREVIISQIVADSDGKITLKLSNNEIDMTYENGVLQFSSEDPAAEANTLSKIEEFDATIRAAFPSLASLPGTLVYSGNNIYYHHLSIDNIHQLIDNGTITEDNLLIVDYPYEENDVVVNIYTLDYLTYDEKGRGGRGYDQIQFNISVSSVNLELEEHPEGKSDDERTDKVKIRYFISPKETKINDPQFVDNNYKKDEAEDIVDISIGAPDEDGYGWITLTAKSATTNGPLLIKFSAGNVGRTLRLRVFEKGRQTIAVPKLIKKFEYQFEGDDYTKGIKQEVTPADCGIGSNLIKEGIVDYKITSINQELVNPGDTITIEFGIINKDYCWADDFSSDTTKPITVTLSKLLIPTPTLNHKELIYNGRTQTPTLSDWEIGKYSEYVRIARSGIREAIGDLISRDGKDPGVYFSEFEIKNEYDLYFGWKENENSKTLLVPWEIKKLTIKKPTFALINADGDGYFDYDDTEKVAQINYAEGTEKYIKCSGSNLKETNAGDYSVTLSIYNDRNDKGYTGGIIGGLLNSDPPYADIYEWIDENGNRSSGEIRFVWRINPITIDPPEVEKGVFEYDGNEHLPTLKWPDGKDYSNLVTVSKATNAGIHDITVSINTKNNSNVAFTGGKTSITVKMEITKKPLKSSEYPSETSTIKKEFTGEKQTVKLSDFGSYDSKKITLYSGNEGTYVQTYTAYFKPTNNYCFADGAEYKTSTWNIVKSQVAKPKLKTNLHFQYDGKDKTPFDGDVNSKIELLGDEVPQQNHKEGGYITIVSLDRNSCEWKTGDSDSYTVTWFIDKVDSTITISPKATNPQYNNGSEQALVTSGTASGGTINYALGDNNTTVPTSGWSTSIPKGGELGKTYYVWYYIKGDGNHNDTTPKCVSSKVSKGENPISIKSTQTDWSVAYSSNAQTHSFEAAKDAAGKVTYSIEKQPTGSYFSISDSSKAVLTMKAKTPVSTYGYSVTIRATAAGDDMYESKYVDTTIKVKVNKVQAAFTTTPSAKTGLKYNGEDQELINAGVANAGTIKYYVNTRNYAPTSRSTWDESIPTGSNAGTYYVWYKIDGDVTNVTSLDQNNNPLIIEIEKSTNTITIANQSKTIEYSTSNNELNFTRATCIEGSISYSIKSQKNASGSTVNYFYYDEGGWFSEDGIYVSKKTPVGTYTVVVTAKSSEGKGCSADTKDFTLTITITKKSVAIPTYKSYSSSGFWSKTYTATWNGYDSEIMSVTGNTSNSQPNINNTITATFTLTDNNCYWSGKAETVRSVQVQWPNQ